MDKLDMTSKKEYIAELEKALKKRNVSDVGEILEEYQQHFENKRMDGFSEMEVIARLAEPQIIAQQFSEGGKRPMDFSKIVLCAWISMLDVAVVLAGIILLFWVIVLGATALASVALSFSLITSWHIAYIPAMPYLGALLLGVACMGLGALASIGAVYSFLYVRQWARAYVRWHKNQFDRGRYPNLSITPTVNARLKRILRLICVIALMATGAGFILGYAALAIASGSMEFWHALGWFA